MHSDQSDPKESQTPDPSVYRGMTRAELDAGYNNTEAVHDSAQHMDLWMSRSADVRRGQNAVLNLRYGPKPANRLDFFKAGLPDRGLFIFIHGGYWQRNNKEMFAFVAEGLCAGHVNVATIGYTLAPEASLSEIVSEIGLAIEHLLRENHRLGFDVGKIYIGGWSAGGHLSAILAEHPSVKGFVSISGIFDLEPISKCYLNQKLKLSDDEIFDLSPINRHLDCNKKVLLFAGELELPELTRQSRDYALHLSGSHKDLQHLLVANKNHYSVLDELRLKDGVIAREILHLLD
ncbi:MAG: alpha/beta hydrolase [Alphaproteobacteria bacterium]